MRVLLCCFSSALGGVERRLEAESRILTSLGHEVLVATPRFPGFDNWRRTMEQAGATFIDWHPYKFVERRRYSAPFRWRALASRSVLKRASIDLAHIALPWTFSGVSMAYVLTSLQIPFLVSLRCQYESPPLSPTGQQVVRRAMQGLVGGYAVSEPVLKSFLKHYHGLLPSEDAIQVISNGIDTSRFQPDPEARESMRTSLGINEDEFVVILCGRLEPIKRPSFAVGIFDNLARLAPRSRLLIVGEGPEKDATIAEIARLGLEKRVIMVGSVSDTAPYYAASDCYLSTSASEGCPSAPAEALSSGLPAVVPDNEVFRLLYGPCRAVRLCASSDHENWGPTLFDIATMESFQRKQFSADARDFVVSHMSLAGMNQRLTEFYTRVCATIKAGTS